MKKITTLALLVLLLGACDKDKKGTLNLVFKSQADGQPFLLLSTYNYPDGVNTFSLSNFEFYVSDIKLVKANGDSVKIHDVALVSTYPSAAADLATAAQGVTVSIPGVPEGEYTSIDFGIGLTPALDATTPGDYAPSHPLGTSGGMYWESWGSYIYFKIEGSQTSIPAPSGFRIHAGGGERFHRKSVTAPINVIADGTESVSLTVDINKLFYNDLETIDLSVANDTHYSDTLMNKVAANFPNAIDLQ